MNVLLIPLLTALLPIIGINITYMIAAGYEHVPSCIVYFEGCTTISSTGRAAPESLWFRALIIPSAVLSIICWRMIGAWLECLEQGTYKGARIIQSLGMVAGVFLITYSVALGFIGPEYVLQRRTGVTLFFGFTYLAQLMLARRLWYIAKHHPDMYPLSLAKKKLFLCLFLLFVGLASIPVSNFMGTDNLENIIEWNFSVLMYAYFILVALGWKATGFQAKLSLNINK